MNDERSIYTCGRFVGEPLTYNPCFFGPKMKRYLRCYKEKGDYVHIDDFNYLKRQYKNLYKMKEDLRAELNK